MLVPNKPVKWWINWWLWIYENNVCELRCEPLPSRLHIHIFIRSSHKWFSNIHSQYLSHWSQTMVSYTEIKVTITFQSILNGITWKYCSVAFTCIVTGYSTDQEKRATYAHSKLKFSRFINTCFGQPPGETAVKRLRMCEHWVSHRPMLSYRNCTQPRKPKNQVILKLFKFYFSLFLFLFSDLSKCFFFPHIMYNSCCFLYFHWNSWAGNRRAAGENTYHLRMPYVSLLWCCYKGRITLYFSILF